MKLSELKQILSDNSEKSIQFLLPTGTGIPLHAHVTDVARIDKHFIDCGGTIHSESLCRLQTWYADDTEHRVGAKMLLKVLDKAASFLGSDDLEVDVEYEAPFISQFPITEAKAQDGMLVVQLGIRHTTCLAQDRCLPPATKDKSVFFRPLPKVSTEKCC